MTDAQRKKRKLKPTHQNKVQPLPLLAFVFSSLSHCGFIFFSHPVVFFSLSSLYPSLLHKQLFLIFLRFALLLDPPTI
ncbi:hypothetical protein Patl1_04779 [Pistacia atlantica]|uniref:Uncharacterized protein n=1 Tax=Pistacia atlantica TaxID=434234 RepID=A0ACC1BT00_9ROSI|nr:hypothetical protein Patl1_04779 [Pistacia atlantica]